METIREALERELSAEDPELERGLEKAANRVMAGMAPVLDRASYVHEILDQARREWEEAREREAAARRAYVRLVRVVSRVVDVHVAHVLTT